MKKHRHAPWNLLPWILVVGFALPAAAQSPGAVYTIRAGDALSTVAQRAYGDATDWAAIMFATNRRLGEGLGLQFISDPNAVDPGQKVWIPDAREQATLMQEYDTYLRAIFSASLPQPYRTTRKLRSISPDKPVTVVTWARENQYTLGSTKVKGDVWVTVVPEMKQFCQSLGLDTQALSLRLEQWLGLPPSSNKTSVVEIEVDNPNDAMFRPCPDPSITTNSCPVDFPATVDQEHKNWIFAQYYGAFARAHPTRFPWTALGYTYDWGDPTTPVGASEFIVREGTNVRVTSITGTDKYCSSN